MAKDDRPTAAEKGKGKADDVRELNGDKNENKDGKPVANGKNDEEQKEGRFIRYLYFIMAISTPGLVLRLALRRVANLLFLI